MQETSGKRIQQQTTFWAERVLCGLLYIKKSVWASAICSLFSLPRHHGRVFERAGGTP